MRWTARCVGRAHRGRKKEQACTERGFDIDHLCTEVICKSVFFSSSSKESDAKSHTSAIIIPRDRCDNVDNVAMLKSSDRLVASFRRPCAIFFRATFQDIANIDREPFTHRHRHVLLLQVCRREW